MRLRVLLFLAPAVLAACAHVPRSGGLETLKPAIETFHQRIRWKDFRGASELVVAERRADFEKARHDLNDARDLSISDYQLEDVRLLDEGMRAIVVSRISWVRLPSVSEHTDLVTSEFVFEGVWLLARQDLGPFTPELEPPYPAFKPDAG
ncbi:MAG: hypothetical protein ACYC8T_13815 [Myxococcaceae bacterium]